MAKFEISYNQSVDYDEKVEVDIRLNKRPDKEEYQTILDAIETLDKIAKKYVVVPPVTTTKEK